MIYLDHNATTPLDERVRAAMEPYLAGFYGNPSSLHRQGRLAKTAIDTAREQVASLVGAEPSEVIFTSGGTEANNMAIKGLACRQPIGCILVGATEHPAVAAPLHYLEKSGWRIQALRVNERGRIDGVFDDFSADVRFASIMLANNETGVVQDLQCVAECLEARGVLLHCDAVQAAGKIPVNFKSCGAQLLSISAHKLYGPKGAGALIVKKSVSLEPLLHGGGQERDMRGGTENVAALVGFGKAAELARLELASRQAQMLALRCQLEAELSDFSDVTIFAADAERLPNTLQFALASIDGEALVMALDKRGIAVSSGSACASGAGQPSPVLLAMGVDPNTAKGAIRVSLGKDNSHVEIVRFLEELKLIYASLRRPENSARSLLTMVTG